MSKYLMKGNSLTSLDLRENQIGKTEINKNF